MERDSDRISTTEDARKFLERIALTNGPEPTQDPAERDKEQQSNNVTSLKSTPTSTHTSHRQFLMEVIQNADNNDYSRHDTPTVFIKVKPESIVIEYNGLDLSSENVRTICRAGQSSKSFCIGCTQKCTRKEFIGFDSVFKLANRVHIRSPSYCFQLDQRRELGMTTPEWDEEFFENSEQTMQTTIVLDQSNSQSSNFVTVLQQDLDAIDPLLLFSLLRIDRLHITSVDGMRTFSKCFHYLDRTVHPGVVSIKDEDSGSVRSFYKTSYTHPFVGTEDRRPHATHTNIQLLFPVKMDENSGRFIPLVMETCSVAYYWPMGDYGYRFVIQADFILMPNTQMVDEGNAWNRNIAEGIPLAFKKAINQLNLHGSRRELVDLVKMWPWFTIHKTKDVSSYWIDIGKSIRRCLQDAPVLMNQAGGLSIPKQLKHLDWAHDLDGKPMLGNASDYVSTCYPQMFHRRLSWLGVTDPNWKWMCEALQKLFDEDVLQARMGNDQWYSDLAEMILEASRKFSKDGSDLEGLSGIPLIPLRDGTWQCPPPEDDPIYFPLSSETAIPPGLSFSFVDEKACACPTRRRLFMFLGVKSCAVHEVAKRIIDHQANLGLEHTDDMTAQLRYLYKMRKQLDFVNMEKIRFLCSTCDSRHSGRSTYADISATGDLKQLFSGHDNAHFMRNDYFAELEPRSKIQFAKWLGKTTGVAMAPRLVTRRGHDLHTDFEWLLNNKKDHVLELLRQNWNSYSKSERMTAGDTLVDREFMCRSGHLAALGGVYLPLPELMKRAEDLGDVNHLTFLNLPGGEPKDWKFLSNLGVGVAEEPVFYLQILCQLPESGNIQKAKQLYLAIQSSAAPRDYEIIREYLENICKIHLPDHRAVKLKDCVWSGPRGFSSKPALLPIYGHKLARLFQQILKVPDVTTAETLEYLRQLEDTETTTIADVIDAYVFLHDNFTESSEIEGKIEFIAVPLSESDFEWRSLDQCVWNDDEFSQHELQLESKMAIRDMIERNAPSSKKFFTECLKLPNAGINEMLGDLRIMQERKRSDIKRIHRLYGRIQSLHHIHAEEIKYAFKEHRLIFNSKDNQWLSPEDCVWGGTVLREKYDLRQSWWDYMVLFTKTLRVPEATLESLVTELLETTKKDPIVNSHSYMRAKLLLRHIVRLSTSEDDLRRLHGRKFWPCHTPDSPRKFCSIDEFLVNDRQDLFDMFSSRHTFLDFDFDTARLTTGTFKNQASFSFLSKCVSIETSFQKPLKLNHASTTDFRARADSLVEYSGFARCKLALGIPLILMYAKVWNSAKIEKKYSLDGDVEIRGGAGSHVELSTEESGTTALNIYYSMDEPPRNCALHEDFPEQLAAALGFDLACVPMIHTLLHVPLDSLKALLVRKGITSGNNEYGDSDELERDVPEGREACRSTTITTRPRLAVMGTESKYTGSVDPESTRAWAERIFTPPTATPFKSRRHDSASIASEDGMQCSARVSSTEDFCQRPNTSLATSPNVYSNGNCDRTKDPVPGIVRNIEFTFCIQTGEPNQIPEGRSSSFVNGPRGKRRSRPQLRVRSS